MSTHEELVNEMSIVNNMSTDERLIHARRLRAQQLVRWQEFENDQNELNQNGIDEIKKEKTVKFGDCTTLLEAAARNDYDEVKELLNQKVDPNEANDDGLTVLHQVCIDNFEDLVVLLLDYQANVNAVDSEFWTPLHAACTCAHTNIAKVLVQRGANLLALNTDQNMPYDICEENATLEFIEQAMAKEGITQEQINEARLSPEKSIIKDIEKMINAGEDINVTDKVGASILHVAAANGFVDLTRFFLLHVSCDVDAQDKDGWTPLHAAACWCQMDIIEILTIEHNADPSIKNSLGEIPADVTEDEEIKSLLQKLLKAHRESKKSKVLRGLLRPNGSTRRSGLRGQSFKGRSKRDKKKGIASVEANSEAEFWHKGPRNDSYMDDLEDDGSPLDGSPDGAKQTMSNGVTSADTKLNVFVSRDVDENSNKKRFIDTRLQDSPKRDVTKKKLNPFKKNFDRKRISSEKSEKQQKTLNELKLRRTLSEGTSGNGQQVATPQNLDDSDMLDMYKKLNGSSKKRSCLIM